MEICERCGHKCQQLHTILVRGRGANYWSVECCAKCKAHYKRHNDQLRRREAKQYTR